VHKGVLINMDAFEPGPCTQCENDYTPYGHRYVVLIEWKSAITGRKFIEDTTCGGLCEDGQVEYEEKGFIALIDRSTRSREPETADLIAREMVEELFTEFVEVSTDDFLTTEAPKE